MGPQYLVGQPSFLREQINMYNFSVFTSDALYQQIFHSGVTRKIFLAVHNNFYG